MINQTIPDSPRFDHDVIDIWPIVEKRRQETGIFAAVFGCVGHGSLANWKDHPRRAQDCVACAIC